ncbi:MAG: hypothetical protein V2I38_14555 [Alcanivoracaceae bacterium]|jgi:hypothetical protein|nr:hypothetical protein [Alcanivoracaceae bacterium]
MIGNRYSHGQLGYTILEQGDINRNTLQLDVSAWLVCRPDGEVIGSYPSIQAARDAIDQTTSNLA